MPADKTTGLQNALGQDALWKIVKIYLSPKGFCVGPCGRHVTGAGPSERMAGIFGCVLEFEILGNITRRLCLLLYPQGDVDESRPGPTSPANTVNLSDATCQPQRSRVFHPRKVFFNLVPVQTENF